MKSVVIVQGDSSAFLYFQECLRRDLLPVVINPPDFAPDREVFKDKVGDKAIVIDMKSMGEYDSLLERVKKYDPVCVVCGAAGGVVIADRMAKDLGLKGNDPETTWRRDTKNGMHQSLKEAGLRYIRTKVIHEEKDIDEFWDEVKPKKTMMKYDNGAGTVGNRICYTREEAKSRLREMAGEKNYYNTADTTILQEFIEGDEYIVDTVSCDGQHVLTEIWKYHKVFTKDNAVIYDYAELIVEPTPGISKMVDYAFKVVDAVGFKYGPCHGEYKIDENGPILIETNPRPLGLSMSMEFLDDCLDNHVTDVALDSYLDPERFQMFCKKFYVPKKYAIMKMIISPKECDLNLLVMNHFLKNVKSFSSSSLDFSNRTIHSPKTVDLETIPFWVKLCHADYETIRKDLELIRCFESEFFDLLLDMNKTVDSSSSKPDIESYIARIPRYYNTLVITDDEEYGIKYGKRYKRGENAPVYDMVLFACCGKSTVAERFSRFNSAVESLISGGLVGIVPEAWEKLPYGSDAAEFMIRVTGCRIAIPAGSKMRIIAAYKY